LFVFLPPVSLRYLMFDLLTILLAIMLTDIVFSWLISARTRLGKFYSVAKFVRSVSDPLCNPVRRVLPHPSRTGNMDFAPMVVMMLVQAIRNALL
jgi:uncharacterized protein YggT (Ycf19 family)